METRCTRAENSNSTRSKAERKAPIGVKNLNLDKRAKSVFKKAAAGAKRVPVGSGRNRRNPEIQEHDCQHRQ